MKNLYILVVTICILMTGCQKETLETTNIKEEQSENYTQRNISNIPKKPSKYPSNQVVVKYRSSTSILEKEVLRDQYGVISVKKCPCADPNLELWTLDENDTNNSGGTIEEKVISLKEDDGLEGADFNPFIQQQAQQLINSFDDQNINLANNSIKQENDGVTIAVLDTGIDYTHFNFTTPFLYNSQLIDNECDAEEFQDYFGWDFVNQDNNPFDDHGHGTIVGSIIHEKLISKDVNFQILPIKVFDSEGNGVYFDVLCGFKYALHNRDVDIINMSFGFYGNSYDLFEQFVDESQQDKLLVTSAGNRGISTDVYPHYPSNYEVSNLFSVAALSEEFESNISLTEFSNFGNQSVDIAAPGENIIFPISPNQDIQVSGTSFSAAYVSAISGALYSEDMTVQEHINEVMLNTILNNNLSTIKYRSYIQF